MKFINKLERKFGKYAIHNLMYYIIILYGIGVVVDLIMPPGFYSQFLSLKASAVSVSYTHLRRRRWKSSSGGAR